MSPRHRARSALTTLALAAALVAVLPGCAASRSPEQFCKVYWEEKESYLTKYENANEAIDAAGEKDPLLGGLAGLATGLQAVGDVVIIFEKLDKVAPDDIEPDVAAIRDSLKAQTEAASGAVDNPLGAIAGGLVSSLTTAGSWDRVSKYVVAECGEKG